MVFPRPRRADEGGEPPGGDGELQAGKDRLAVVGEVHVGKADLPLEAGGPAAVQGLLFGAGGGDGLAQGPVGALPLDQLLVLLLDLAQERKGAPDGHREHHHQGEVHGEEAQGEVDAQGDEQGKQPVLAGVEHGVAPHLAAQGPVEAAGLHGQDPVGQMLPAHRLERFDRLEGVGQAAHQGSHQLGLAAAGAARHAHQKVGDADHRHAGAEARQGRPPGDGAGHGPVDQGLDQEGEGSGAEDEGLRGALGLGGKRVGELSHRLVEEILPAGAQHRAQQFQAQVGAHLGGGVAHLALGQNQHQALHRGARHHHPQEGSEGGLDVQKGQGGEHRPLELARFPGRGGALEGYVQQRQQGRQADPFGEARDEKGRQHQQALAGIAAEKAHHQAHGGHLPERRGIMPRRAPSTKAAGAGGTGRMLTRGGAGRAPGRWRRWPPGAVGR